MPLPDHKTKIVATIGPASDTPEMLERLIRAGLNIARLNFSHGDFAAHAGTHRPHPRGGKRHRMPGHRHGGLARPEDAPREDRAGAYPTARRRELHPDQRGGRRQPAPRLHELRAAAARW